MRGIINQVNQSDIDTTIFTSQIGEDKGTRSRGCGSCFTKLWDWICGVSYDKTTVISRINTTFRGVQDRQLDRMDKGTLRTFSAQLQALDAKLSKNNLFAEDLQETITRIDAYVNPKPSRQSSHTRTNGSSAHRTAMPRSNHRSRSLRTAPMQFATKSVSRERPAQKAAPRVDAQAQAKATREAEATRNKEQNMGTLQTVAEESGRAHLETVERIYAKSDIPQRKVSDWILETFDEISAMKMLEQPQSKAAITSKFKEILEGKVCGFNLRVLEKHLPDIFTNPAYDLGRSGWLPGREDVEAPLVEFMKTIPFNKATAKHIKAKLHLPEVLGLPLQGFTKKQLKKAYKKLSLQFHPDKNMGNPAAAAKCTEVSEAYQKLLKRFE